MIHNWFEDTRPATIILAGFYNAPRSGIIRSHVATLTLMSTISPIAFPLSRHFSAARADSIYHLGLIGPAVKLILHRYQIDPADVQATGPKRNLLKSDVLAFIDQRSLSPPKATSTPPTLPAHTVVDTSRALPTRPGGKKPTFVDIPLSNARSKIARSLTASKNTIPHSYLSALIPAKNIQLLLRRMMSDGEKGSLDDFLIKAAALALRSVPKVNSQWSNGTVRPMRSINVAVSLATPDGSTTAVIANADRLGVGEIGDTIREWKDAAAQNKLLSKESQSGTFTISNLGDFGISHFTAIVMPPQVATLAVGALETGVNEFAEKEENLYATLCYDSRALDERDADAFMSNLRMLLAEPETMLSGTEGFSNVDLEEMDLY